MGGDQIRPDPRWVPLVEAPIRLQLGSAHLERKYGRTCTSSYYNVGWVTQIETETDDGSYVVYIQYEDRDGVVGTTFLVDLFDYLGIKRSIAEVAGEERERWISPERARQATEKVLRQAVQEGRLRLRARESLNALPIELSVYGLPELKITNWGKGWGEYTTGQQVFDLQVAMVVGASPQMMSPASDDAGQSHAEPTVKAQSPPRKRGRPKGTDYSGPDAPFLQEMRHLIETGQASSVTEAAQMVAHKAKGASPVAIIKRLQGRYTGRIKSNK
jgi:hypothetical protein